MSKKIILIDDQPNQMKYFIKSLRERGSEVTVLDNADAAYEWFRQERPVLDAVILDIMMPPGEHLNGEDHHNGLRTGIFILSRIITVNAAWIHKPRLRPPIAVLTNTANPQTLELLDKESEEQRGYGTFRIWHKPDVDPENFAEQLLSWLNEIKLAKPPA